MRTPILFFLLFSCFSAFSQNDSTETAGISNQNNNVFLIGGNDNISPVKGMKFLFERMSHLERAGFFENDSIKKDFKIIIQFYVSEDGKLLRNSIKILRTPLKLKPESILLIENALDIEWMIPANFGKPTKQKLFLPILFHKDE